MAGPYFENNVKDNGKFGYNFGFNIEESRSKYSIEDFSKFKLKNIL